MITFGSDPEFMLVKNGKIVSAIGIIPGTKDNPHVRGENKFFYDNVMAECTIKPSSSKEEAVSNFQDAIKTLDELAGESNLHIQASHFYDSSELKHPDALKIACDPEDCAYELRKIHPPVESFKKGNLRTAGGHIHLGSEILQSKRNAIFATRMMDLFLGTASVLFEQDDERAVVRKKFYGLAGRYRSPKHGVEYRTLNNFWISSPKSVELVFRISEFVANFIAEGRHLELWSIDEETLQSEEFWDQDNPDPSTCHICHGYDAKELRKAIDTNDRRTCGKYLETLSRKYMPKELHTDIVLKIAFNTKYNFRKEWNLD